jgi:hypothetical protein
MIFFMQSKIWFDYYCGNGHWPHIATFFFFQLINHIEYS